MVECSRLLTQIEFVDSNFSFSFSFFFFFFFFSFPLSVVRFISHRLERESSRTIYTKKFNVQCMEYGTTTTTTTTPTSTSGNDLEKTATHRQLHPYDELPHRFLSLSLSLARLFLI